MKVTYRLDFGFFKNLFHFIMFCAKLEIYGHFKFFNEENSSENTEPLKQYRFEYFLYFSSANWNLHCRKIFCQNNKKNYEYRWGDMGDGYNVK